MTDRTKATCPDCHGRMYFDFMASMYHCWRCGSVHSPDEVTPWEERDEHEQ